MPSLTTGIKLLPALLALLTISCGGESYDLLVRNGSLLDGSGAGDRRADVGVRGDRIAAIGDLSSASAARVIDASGLVVAPGFIDMHNHSDETLLVEPRCESMIRQGVTTMVLGENGSAGPRHAGEREWTTLGGYFDHVEQKGVAANIASYVGHGQVWTYVKGEALTAATPEEIGQMKRQIDLAMREGALGLSTSLLTPPANQITTEQLIALAKVAAEHGGIYSTHIRDEGLGVFDSIQEAIDIGTGADIRVDVIHLKVAEKSLWGKMPDVIAMFEKAQAEGLDIQANVYPYRAGQNNLRILLPPWAHDGGNEKMLERLRDPRARARLRREIEQGLPGWYNHYHTAEGGWEGMLLVSLSKPENQKYAGKRMSEVIAGRGGDPFDVLFDLLLEENGSVRTIFFHHHEDDMQYALKQPFVSIGSDGAAVSVDGEYAGMKPHPRWYGTFPRVLGRYVRELGLLTLPDAVKKMTSMNAAKANLKDRGLLQEGYFADITLFDPGRVIDRATYAEPRQYPEGIRYVIVNGQIVLDGEQHTGALPGRALRGPGYVAAD